MSVGAFHLFAYVRPNSPQAARECGRKCGREILTRALNRLSALAVKKATGPAALQDGGGLILRIGNTGSKHWVLRIQFRNKRTDIGLGGYPAVSLENARKAAQSSRERAMRGEDPSPKPAAHLLGPNATDNPATTFRDVFEDFFQLKKKSLSNGKHIWQWTTTISRDINNAKLAEYEQRCSPHMIRRGGATMMAQFAPDRLDDASVLMDNSSTVRDRHYNLATTHDASLLWCELLEDLLADIIAAPRHLNCLTRA